MRNRSHACTKIIQASVVVALLASGQAIALPQSTTLTPTNVINTASNLRGTVNPHGQATTTWFEWGPADALTHLTAPASAGSGSAEITTIASISNLTQGIIYQCRLVASNQSGMTRGRAVAFGVPIVVLNGDNPAGYAQYDTYLEAGVTNFGNPLRLAAGFHHNLVARGDGRVIAWGDIDNGKITVPPAATNIIGVAAGSGHSLALRANGTITGWGYTNDGAVHIPDTATNVVAIAAGGYHSLALRSDGTAVGWGIMDAAPNDVPVEATNLISVVAGQFHSLALRADGRVFGWGANWDLQAEVPPEATNIVAIAAGGDHSLALRTDGTVMGWGANGEGEVSIPEGATNIVAIAAGFYHNLALRADGTVLGWGANYESQITIPETATNTIAIAAGVSHSLALQADGKVIAWGLNDRNQTNVANGLRTLSLLAGTTGSLNMSVLGTYTLTYRATNILGFSAAASRSINIVAPRIVSQSRQPGGTMHLVGNFLPGRNLSVLATSNLTASISNWSNLGLTIETSAGQYEFDDTGAANHPQRFYQLLLE